MRWSYNSQFNMTSLSQTSRVKMKALAALTLFTIVVMFFVSNDSPFANVNNHVDSAIFFMSGKAWANGLMPYVDFSDSKASPMVDIYGWILDFTY